MTERVKDRRRFDADGNPREAVEGTREQAEPPLPACTEEPPQDYPAPPPEAEPEREAQASGEAPAHPAVDPELVRAQLELVGARRRVDELARAYQAVMQDREEFKQRLARERERMIDLEKGKAAAALLEGIDELDRCLAASPADESPLAKGVRLIRDKLLAKAQETGIQRIEVVGKPFDPNVAEAVDMEVTADEDADQRVTAELDAGYRLNDRVIRPARVKVAKFVRPAQA